MKRDKNPTDGRQVLVSLTKTGLKKVNAALLDHAANELAIIDALQPDQRDQLIDLLRLLHHAVIEHARPSWPAPAAAPGLNQRQKTGSEDRITADREPRAFAAQVPERVTARRCAVLRWWTASPTTAPDIERSGEPEVDAGR